jgi:ribonuclease HII
MRRPRGAARIRGRRAVDSLPVPNRLRPRGAGGRRRAIIRDACASIVAKVRDRLMRRLAARYPDTAGTGCGTGRQTPAAIEQTG